MSALFGVNDFNAEMFSTKMEDMLAIIQQVNKQFRDPVSLFYIKYLHLFKL